MIGFVVALDLSGLPAHIERLKSALDASMLEGLDQVAFHVAANARESHPYQNRTGDLESSTQPDAAEGSFLLGTLRSGVVATESYAEHVDGNDAFAFLQPAFDREEHAGYATVQDALDAACRRAWP